MARSSACGLELFDKHFTTNSMIKNTSVDSLTILYKLNIYFYKKNIASKTTLIIDNLLFDKQ